MPLSREELKAKLQQALAHRDGLAKAKVKAVQAACRRAGGAPEYNDQLRAGVEKRFAPQLDKVDEAIRRMREALRENN